MALRVPTSAPGTRRGGVAAQSAHNLLEPLFVGHNPCLFGYDIINQFGACVQLDLRLPQAPLASYTALDDHRLPDADALELLLLLETLLKQSQTTLACQQKAALARQLSLQTLELHADLPGNELL